MMQRVEGYCPMGCGETLFLAPDGHITCSWSQCDNPTAVADLLADHETEHIVNLEADGFSVQHPLRERLKGDLFKCRLHERIAALTGPPRMIGRYRVRFDDRYWHWEPAFKGGA